ncbi:MULTISPECIES: amino acid ABC transporter permease [Aeromicrobium]|uniref:amino acid ABC transporter permease n=1 Tax=Aeromicrobium TaxID=2040 RepID=UPI0007003948|nr:MULTISPECIES: amino acid ABC transporter permease [Aeromicrobium]KQX74090.1 ABC transporter permease [Aeromicrobium sp. Root472D3]MCL8251669.1 amino acid ABC transporter permease [Aeromicrobium fastidiosum]
MTSPAGAGVSRRQLERDAYRRRRARSRAAVAVVSTLVVLGGLAVVVLQSPGWDRVRQTYFDVGDAKAVLPDVAEAFWLNIRLFLVAEVLILVVAITVAIIRVVPSPALAPVKLLAVVYTDVFRGTPTILVVFLIGFGVPALDLAGTPTSLFWLGVIALTLCYGAYVAEVLRAGILSVHPTQWASGRALGLSYAQTMRHIVLPQAVRRVTPPLLNDFVSLQKDTALLSIIGLVEALRVAQVDAGRTFAFTGYVVAACFFIVATIPLARLTDYLTVRSLRRENGI